VGSDAKVTEAGRKVYGGDGITPDYCVGPPTPSKFMAYLLARQAFIGFSRGFAPAETNGKAEIAGAGSRPDATTGKVKTIGLDFKVDDAVLAEFRTFLEGRKLKYTEEDLGANREALVREITEEVLKQAFGEGAARRRSLAWDPQFQRALELVPKAEQLLKDPQRFVSELEASKRLAAGSRP
jgi:carboxyl-terminal processing protease